MLTGAGSKATIAESGEIEAPLSVFCRFTVSLQ